MNAEGERIVVALSGGVDSSVAALVLEREGYAVEAVFMKNWEEDDEAGYCAAAADLADAEQVCERLGIELHTVNFATEYWEQVFTPFLASYAAGDTPNPDIACNRFIKFDAFLNHAAGLGADGIATGHYARIRASDDGMRLLKGIDAEKDQSYFLYALDQRQLARSRFPLGGLTKSEVRRMAAGAGLPTHEKKGSTGICFIGERPFKAFLGRYITPQPGTIEDPEGHVVGTHDGLPYYTLGQRRGLGIGGRPGAAEAPWYVVRKDVARNTLVVAQAHDHPWLYSSSLSIEGLRWVAGKPPPTPLRCSAKIRYRQSDQVCEILDLDRHHCRVRFAAPQWAAAPGQSVVFYRGDECLGGGTIAKVGHS